MTTVSGQSDHTQALAELARTLATQRYAPQPQPFPIFGGFFGR